MPYPAAIQESAARVEATRPSRLSESFPRLSPEERETVLRTFHPDYIADAFRELRLGRNKGDRASRELADLLEAAPVLAPEAPWPGEAAAECDVLVVGGGGAGASAALLAQENGADVLLATKLRFGDANTIMAQGGIQAADKDNDSLATHFLDVMGGGGFVNDPNLVEALVSDAPGVIAWLESLGAMFDKEPDGALRTIHGGGTSRKRMHAARDYTGAEIMRTLRDEVRSRSNGATPGTGKTIRIWEFRPAIELLLDDEGRAAGAILKDLDTGRLMPVRAGAVVLATGGSGRLHYQGFPTTNHTGATGDGLVLAYRAGARLVFIDTMQYHPTGAAFPEQILGQLVTEKVRGLGAQVCNAAGEQFVYPLETRDVEAAAFIRECLERGRGVATPTGQPAVWLDAPMIDVLHGPGTVARELPAMARQYRRFGIDLAREPILVYPTLHYQNGGVAIRPDGSTDVSGLYVAGEAAGGIHGRNRLMGNSLLDICVFGRRAGRAAAEWARSVQPGGSTPLGFGPGGPGLAHLEAWGQARQAAGLADGQPAPIVLPDYRRK